MLGCCVILTGAVTRMPGFTTALAATLASRGVPCVPDTFTTCIGCVMLACVVTTAGCCTTVTCCGCGCVRTVMMLGLDTPATPLSVVLTNVPEWATLTPVGSGLRCTAVGAPPSCFTIKCWFGWAPSCFIAKVAPPSCFTMKPCCGIVTARSFMTWIECALPLWTTVIGFCSAAIVLAMLWMVLLAVAFVLVTAPMFETCTAWTLFETPVGTVAWEITPPPLVINCVVFVEDTGVELGWVTILIVGVEIFCPSTLPLLPMFVFTFTCDTPPPLTGVLDELIIDDIPIISAFDNLGVETDTWVFRVLLFDTDPFWLGITVWFARKRGRTEVDVDVVPPMWLLL